MPKGTTKKEANEKLGELEKKIRQGSYTPAKDLPTFTKVADAWLASKEPNIRHSTYTLYKGYVENHLKPYFGQRKINQINFETVETFKNQSLKEGVTAATLRKVLVALGGIMIFAVRMRYADHNPVREVEKPRGKSVHDEKNEILVFRPKEIRALLDATAGQKDKVLFMMAALTGMRQGELLGLKWGDVDWKNSQVLVRRTYNHGRFYDPKSKASRRRVDLPPELVQELKKWKLACPSTKLELVFPSKMGNPECGGNIVKRRFLPALRRAGLPKIRFHDLRHTYASLLIAQGEHPKYIQTQLGHSSIKMTMDIYGHLMDTVNREAASRLGKTVLGDYQSNGSKMVAVDG